MMNVIKKTVGLLLVLMVLTGTLVGCAVQQEDEKLGVETSKVDTEEVESADQESSDADVPETVAVKPSGKIVVWTWDAGKNALDLNMEAFNAEYPDIEVEYQLMGNNDVYQKMIFGLSAGGEGLPDVVTIETSNLAQFLSVGGLMDLTEQTAPYKEKMNAFKWVDASKDGKVYAMPWDSGPVALYYRTDLFEQAGYDSDPEAVQKLLATWDDYYEVAKVMKEKTGAFMMSSSQDMFSGRDYEKLLVEKESWYFDADGTPQLDSQDSIEVMTYLTNLVKEGYAENTAEWTQGWYDSFTTGTVATVPAASWLGGFLTSWIAPDAAGLWKVVPLPAWEIGGNTASNDGGSNLCIPDVSENKEAAWAFIEFMLGREASQMTMYRALDIFPALNTTYSDPFYDEEVPYYGNQKVRRVFADVTANIPSFAYQEFYSQANESIIEAYSKIILNDVSVEQALKEANEQVISKTE